MTMTDDSEIPEKVGAALESSEAEAPGTYEGSLKVSITILDPDGNPVGSDETFYAGVFVDSGHTQKASSDLVSTNPIAIPMNRGSYAEAAVPVTITGDTPIHLYVTETTEDGTPVKKADSFGYDWTVKGGVLMMSSYKLNAEVEIVNQWPEGSVVPTIEPLPTEVPPEVTETPETPDATPTSAPAGETITPVPAAQGATPTPVVIAPDDLTPTPAGGEAQTHEGAVQTGDNTDLAGWLALLFASFVMSIAIFSAFFRRRKI